MDDGVALTDVAEELIAQSFALGSAFHEAGNVDNLAGGRYDSARVNYLGEAVETLIGNADDAQVGFYRTEREVCRLCLGARQAVRSEEHTSELQSRQYIVCRLLLEKK